MIYVKKHSNGVLAACDSELIGKKITQGNLELDVKKEFYKGELVKPDKFKDHFLQAENLNLVGEKTINLAKKEIDLNTKEINGVPYAILFTFI